MTETLAICPLQDLPPGTMRLVEWEDLDILVANCDGAIRAMENRCSHDNAPLGEGTLDARACTIECPRHGSVFDLGTGRPLTLPAYRPVETYPVTVENGVITLEVD